MTELEYLESERIKLWEKILDVENRLEKKTSDYEKEARQHSKKASEYRNRCEETKDKAFDFLNQINSKYDSIEKLHADISNAKSQIDDLLSTSDVNEKNISNYSNNIEERKESIEKSITTLENLFENEDEYIENIEKLNSHFTEGEEINSKIQTLHKAILSKKKEIDEIHREIYGYNDENENGEEVQVEGLKDKLEDSYNELEDRLEEFNKKIDETFQKTQEDYTNFINEKNSSYNSIVEKWKKEYSNTLDKIESLLPNALTVGLSYAYSEKREEEVKESEKYGNRFRNAAIGLVLISLIPFAVSVFSLFDDKPIKEVIYDMPRLVLAILPLYVPVLWLAYSANKKQNLSKRLIEEYSHKEVLSKTFEGLSTQIENIDDNGISADLRVKLLYNIISISSENPGKLISDYDKSDHPLTDALEQSVKLANAVERLSDVPGLKRITTMLANKSERIIDDVANKVSDGLSHVTSAKIDKNKDEEN